jgi:hypothetical protein
VKSLRYIASKNRKKSFCVPVRLRHLPVTLFCISHGSIFRSNCTIQNSNFIIVIIVTVISQTFWLEVRNVSWQKRGAPVNFKFQISTVKNVLFWRELPSVSQHKRVPGTRFKIQITVISVYFILFWREFLCQSDRNQRHQKRLYSCCLSLLMTFFFFCFSSSSTTSQIDIQNKTRVRFFWA